MNPIPRLYVYAAILIAFVLYSLGLVAWGHHRGAQAVQAKWDAQILTDAQAAAIHAVHVDLVSQAAVTQYVDRLQVVLTQGATITKEVTKYVTPETDRRYSVPWGFVRLYNAAAIGALPDAIATQGPDDAPSPVVMSQLANAVNDNFTACRANAEQLSNLQDWLRQQQSLSTKKGP